MSSQTPSQVPNPVRVEGVSSQQKQQRLKQRKSSTQGYNLGYFTLWWIRMGREGIKEQDARMRKEEDDQTSLELMRMLTNNIHVLEPRVCTDRNVTNVTETEEVICERPTASVTVLSQPNMSDNFSNLNEGEWILPL